MIVTRSDIESFKRFVPKLALAGAAVLILSAFAPSSDAAVFTAREGDAPLEFTLPAHETTMVAIPADPIASAVYDRHLIDVQTDAASGMLYVLPKMEGSAMVYVTCRSGETAPLHLTFTADAEPRTIILEKSVRRAEQANAPVRVPAAPLRAEGFPAEMKRLVTLVLRGEETDEVSRTAMTEPTQGAAAAMKRLAPLRVRIEGIWRSRHAEAVELTVKNGTVFPVEINPELLSGSVWAAAATETSLDNIHDGARVPVPNDAANTTRAYVLLQKAGWITLNPDVELSTVTQDDIAENPYNIEFTEMSSTNIPGVLDDFDYAVITGSIVYNAGMDASTALLQEDILPHLLLQVVVKEENKDAQWAKDIVAAYHSDAFKEYLDKNNNGLWYVPDKLFAK